VSQSPLLDPVGAAPLVAPLAVTLESEELLDRGAVVPAAPAASPLVPVDGVVVLAGGALPLLPALEPMPDPDWVCAKAEKASSAANVAAQIVVRFMEMLLWRRWNYRAFLASCVP
jgi:hypothetical protein